jgi:hypothetical protein
VHGDDPVAAAANPYLAPVAACAAPSKSAATSAELPLPLIGGTGAAATAAPTRAQAGMEESNRTRKGFINVDHAKRLELNRVYKAYSKRPFEMPPKNGGSSGRAEKGTANEGQNRSP